MASRVKPGRNAALKITTPGGQLQIVLLTKADSLALWKGRWQGRDRIFLSKAGLVLDGENLRLTSTDRDDLSLGIYPAPNEIAFNEKSLRARSDGIFQRFTPQKPKAISLKATFEKLQSAGPVESPVCNAKGGSNAAVKPGRRQAGTPCVP